MRHCDFDGIPFDILAPMTDWRIEAIRHKEQVPYSNITITERIGHAPATATWTLAFSAREHWYDFVARFGAGTPGTLTLPRDLQSLKGTEITRENPPRWFTVLDQVMIDAIGEATMYRGGQVRVNVTFERMVDPVTRLAVVS